MFDPLEDESEAWFLISTGLNIAATKVESAAVGVALRRPGDLLVCFTKAEDGQIAQQEITE